MNYTPLRWIHRKKHQISVVKRALWDAVKLSDGRFHSAATFSRFILMPPLIDNGGYATVRADAGRQRRERERMAAGREHLSSWHCRHIPSQDASLARERSGLTERPTGKCWRLAPVETQDYMRPYSTLCARAPVYLSLLGFCSMWQDFFFPFLYLRWINSTQVGHAVKTSERSWVIIEYCGPYNSSGIVLVY